MEKHEPEVMDVKVIEVGGGTVQLQIAGGRTFDLPATAETEKWAARKLYKWVKLTIAMAPSV